MAPQVKEAMSWVSEAIETAVGWAFAAGAVYTILFVNFTGNGTLWDSMRGVAHESVPAKIRDVPVQARTVPARPVDADNVAQNRMLLVPEAPQGEITVPVAVNQLRGDQMTDAPSDARAGKKWQKHLTTSLRKFTVYGRGEQSSSASASVETAPSQPGAVAAAAVPAPTPAADGSAFRAGVGAVARPGISDHIAPVSNGAGDGVRNYR